MADVAYTAAPTLSSFHKDEGFVRGIIGPIGSGKSVACCWELFRKACAQNAFEEQSGQYRGKFVRRSRWVVIRNTYRELVDTTMQTWFDWFPKHLGKWRAQDMKFTWIFKQQDETIVYLEVLFRALDRPDDIKKLLSLELTGGWLNEAREIPKPILDMLIGRVGRYPSKRLGGASWYGVIADTNPPDEDHWWYRTFEEDLPHEWSVFHQPSALSEGAENRENLPEKYYERLSAGKDQEWVKVYVHGQYGFVQDGKVIFPEYNDQLHCVHELGLVETTKKLLLGADFGLTPAAVIAQESALDGQIQCIDEVVTDDMGAVRFGNRVNRLINTHYESLPTSGWGDPSGDVRSQTDENTPFLVLRKAGLNLMPAPSNDFILRRESVAKLLTTMTMLGRPALVLSPKCRMLRKALAGGYKYKQMNVSGGERFAEKPDKNMYSHVAEALQYLCLGLGGGVDLISAGKAANSQTMVDNGAYEPLS